MITSGQRTAVLEAPVVYIDKVDNTQTMRMRSGSASRTAALLAAGKSILAFLPVAS
jgi:DNA-binding IclR family transcriptional regulator